LSNDMSSHASWAKLRPDPATYPGAAQNVCNAGSKARNEIYPWNSWRQRIIQSSSTCDANEVRTAATRHNE
jgi:hypothetical protein